MSTAHLPTPPQKFRIEKVTNGDVTFLTMHGVVDENFDGRKLAESIRTKKLVLSLRDVRRFASWGMAEWMNFLRGNAERDLYVVECSTYAVNQINLVTGLLGQAKLLSFYLPYRCGTCSEEFEAFILVPHDREALADPTHSEQVCPTCAGTARMEQYPAAMCATISGLPPVDIDDDVVAFLRSHLKYNLVPDATRFRAHRRVHKGNTYLRLTGSLTALPGEQLARLSEGTTIVDLAGIMFDPADPATLAGWRTYVQAALPTVSTLQLLDCPPGFVESAVHPEDLTGKLKVRTFALLYECTTCNTLTSQLVDVAENLEQLSQGVVPTAHCPSCKFVLHATVAPELVMRLPARERDLDLDKFLAKTRTEPINKLEDCLSIRTPAATPKASGGRTTLYVAVGASLLIGGLAVLTLVLLDQRGTAAATPGAGNQVAPVTTPTPKFQRPDWIMSDVPSSAFCQDMINRLVCVGISSFRGTRNEAVAEATDAALEELVNAVGLKISGAFFTDTVLASYSQARAKALSTLQAAEMDRASEAYVAADQVVRAARQRIVEILKISGGPAVPAQRSDWYWEEYAAEKGEGTDNLVFVRFDVPLDAVKALVEKYSATTEVLGSTTITAFPALAWNDAEFTGGAMLTKAGGALAAAGLVAKHVVSAVGDQRVTDTSGFAQRIEESAADILTLTVKASDAPGKVIEVQR